MKGLMIIDCMIIIKDYRLYLWNKSSKLLKKMGENPNGIQGVTE